MDEKEKQRRQYYLRRAGYDASGDWDSEQEKAWLELITHLKQYQPTLKGFLDGLVDKLTGNDTYLQDPRQQGEIISDDRTEFARELDYLTNHNDNPIGFVYQTVVPAATIAATTVNPLATMRVMIPAATTGIVVGETSNAISRAVTGKDTEELVEPYVGRNVSFLGNPGTYIGAKTSKNFFDFGRYVMDEVYPASYIFSERLPEIAKASLRAMNPFSSAPNFHNRLPKWASKHNPIDKQARIENQARWVGVPKEEVPRIVTRDNPDGTVGFTLTRIGSILPDDTEMNVGDFVLDKDHVFGPGGEHSRFTLVRRSPDNNARLWLYEDEQVLNPQWLIASALKSKFGIKDESKAGKVIDWFGKKDLKTLLGFKNDVNYKQYLFETDRGIFPIPNEQVEGLLK